MITWMQKHKKYLVITIWVSTIAFVGAGFVGWGAYSFSNASSSVATVGGTPIALKEFQSEYSKLYNIYARLSGGNFDKEQAQKMGLQNQAMENLISQTLLLNYADTLGLRISEEKVMEKIASIDSFKKDGMFNKEIYHAVLKQNNIKPKDFEESVKKDLLLAMVFDILKPALSPLEKETILSSFYMQDKLKIEILKASDIKVTADDAEVKSYWEQNKEKYLSKKEYVIESVTTLDNSIVYDEKELEEFYAQNKELYKDAEGKILPLADAKIKVESDLKHKFAEKENLREYVKLKKGEITGQKITFKEDDAAISPALLNELNLIKNGDTFKPIEIDGGYMSAKLLEVKERAPLSFEAAKITAKVDLLMQKREKELKAKADTASKDFQGTQVDWVDRESVGTLAGLSEEEGAEFLNYLFSSDQKNGSYVFSDKAIVYEILEQKLLPVSKLSKNVEFLENNSLQIKQKLIEQAFLADLQKDSDIEVYIK